MDRLYILVLLRIQLFHFEQPYIVLYESHLRDCLAIGIDRVLLLTTYLEE